jgi:FKBP-type peptidyl-prolyl cis-trans isomerase
MRLEKPAHPGSIEEAFLMMHKGDSAIFKVDAWNFYHYTRKLVDPPSFATANTFLTFNVRLVDIQRSDDFEYQKQERESTLRIEEQSLINRYLMAEEIQQKPLPSGIYIIPIEETEGDNLKMGDIVAIHYIASFIDGKVFDNTYQNNLPFSFKLGNGEIIPGLEEGISKLHVGEKARIIIPFSLAYQSENKGPIPPYSTLVFDVEIISANGNE